MGSMPQIFFFFFALDELEFNSHNNLVNTFPGEFTIGLT